MVALTSRLIIFCRDLARNEQWIDAKRFDGMIEPCAALSTPTH